MSNNQTAIPMRAEKSEALSGNVLIPGDKSISHRALILGALAAGETRVEGLLCSDDIMATASALRALGIIIECDEAGTWHVLGRGTGGLARPDTELDFGNSGTGARLMMGVVAGHDISAIFTGDASLSSRPMKRVLEPLARMGASVEDGRDTLPLKLTGAPVPVPVRIELEVPSAQVKSAILLAGLNTPGRTAVIEPVATRDHTERMLGLFGADIQTVDLPGSGCEISLTGEAELNPQHIIVPGDPSSAAFAVVAALIVPGSDVMIENVMVNPARAGLFDTLIEMGAQISFLNERSQSGEQVFDLHVKAGALNGVHVPATRAPSMIDEYPVLAVAAAFADGETIMEGLDELRVKESDRLSAIYEGLKACGVACKAGDDFLRITGSGKVPGAGRVTTYFDHRIAMAFLVMGLASEKPVRIDDGAAIATSFPSFLALMQEIGAKIIEEKMS